MADAERLDPSLLSERQRDEEPELDELRNREVLVKLRPQGIVGDVGIPDDRARIRKRDFLAFAEAGGFFELQQIVVLLFGESFPSSLDGALDPSVLAVDRLRNVDAAELLDAVIADAMAEGKVPRLRERADDARHVGTNRLALRARCAFPAGKLEVTGDLRIADAGGVDVRNMGHTTLQVMAARASPTEECRRSSVAVSMGSRPRGRRPYLHTQVGSAPPVPRVHDAACGDVHEILQLLPASFVALHALVPPLALFVSGASLRPHPTRASARVRTTQLDRSIQATFQLAFL